MSRSGPLICRCMLHWQVEAELHSYAGEIDAMGGYAAVADLLLIALTGEEVPRTLPVGKEGMTVETAALGGFFSMRCGKVHQPPKPAPVSLIRIT